MKFKFKLIVCGIIMGLIGASLTLTPKNFGVNASGLTELSDDYFIDDLSTSESVNRYLRIYDRGDSVNNTIQCSNGKYNVHLNNGYFGTTKKYSNYILKFRAYNTIENRFGVVLGKTDPFNLSQRYDAAGSFTTEDNYAFIIVNKNDGSAGSFVRYFSNGEQIAQPSFTSITTNNYLDYEFKVSQSKIELSINSQPITSIVLSNPLPAGKILFMKPNSSPNYIFDNFSVTSLDYNYFNDMMNVPTLNTSNLKIYDRGAADNYHSMSGTEATVNLNNGYFGTTNAFDEYICKFSVYNSAGAGNRIMFMFGNVDLSIGHAGGANMSAGDFFGIILFNNSIGYYFGSDIRVDATTNVGLSANDFNAVELKVTHTYFNIRLNGSQLFHKDLTEPLPAGKIAFTRSNSVVYHFNSFSVQPIENETNYFEDSFDNNSMNRSYLAPYDRGVASNISMQYNDGEVVATLNNGYLGTVNEYDTFDLKFSAYASASSNAERFIVAFGGTNLSTSYNGGGNSSTTVYTVMFTQSWLRLFINGTSYDYTYPGTSISSSNFSNFEIKLTRASLIIVVNNITIHERTILSPLGTGRIFFAKYNPSCPFHVNEISVQGSDRGFVNKFDDSKKDTVFYHRSAAESGSNDVVDTSTGIETVTINGSDNFCTNARYKDFIFEASMRNTVETRIEFSIGGPSAPATTTYTDYQNVTQGMFRVNMSNSFIRYSENTGTYSAKNLSTGVSSEFFKLRISVYNYHLDLSINDVNLLSYELNKDTYDAGQIIFSKTDSGKNANYEFDYIKVQHPGELIKYDTTVLGVEETDSFSMNSLFKFTLGTSDYAGKEKVNADQLNHAYLEKLNTKDYIRINGRPLSDDTAFTSGRKFINYDKTSTVDDNSYAIETYGNQFGFLYDNGEDVAERGTFDEKGKFISGGDSTAYEIEISEGCEFPSYETVIGDSEQEICYVAEKDYVFVWYDGAFHLSGQSDAPTYKPTKVTNISFTDKGGTNKSINLEFDNFDWPLNNDGEFENIDTQSIQRTVNIPLHILICSEDNVVITSNERFINVWGNGTLTPTFSCRVSPSLNVNNVDAVFIYEGAEFPSYETYLNHNKNVLYRLSETCRFIGDHEGNFYKADKLSTVEYASGFYDAMGSVCENHSTLGYEETKRQLTTKFSVYKSIYKDWLSYESIDELKTSTDSTVLEMFIRYDYVVAKYGLENFLERSVSSSIKQTSLLSKENVVSIVLISSILIISGVSVFFYIRSKKERD